jgi:glycosyltransferase involved in cell wall biosynthesis
MILGYADRLTKRGHKVTVICPQPTFAVKKIKSIPILYPKRNVMNLLSYKPHWIKITSGIKYVPSYDEKYVPDADIVVATAWQTASYVMNYSSKKGRKFYFIQHYESLFHGDKDKVDETYLYPIKKIVVSSWLREILKEKFNADSELIVNPIDFDEFYPVRNSYNKNKRVCMLHHVYEWKGVSDGVKAFKIAKREYPRIKLVMFGAQKRNINIECEYHFRPYGAKLRKLYNSCDIFLSPSWREGSGLASIEAMACKCALVTTDTGGCRDYAIPEKTALVSPPKNPEELAENLIRLLGDEDLFQLIAQNGYEHIQTFTWDKAVDKMEKIFSEKLPEK